MRVTVCLLVCALIPGFAMATPESSDDPPSRSKADTLAKARAILAEVCQSLEPGNSILSQACWDIHDLAKCALEADIDPKGAHEWVFNSDYKASTLIIEAGAPLGDRDAGPLAFIAINTETQGGVCVGE